MSDISPSNDQMPPELAAAILAAMTAVAPIAKSARNDHGRYNYASVDAFLELTNPACAGAGFFVKPVVVCATDREVVVLDSQTKQQKMRRVVDYTFKFRLIHATGKMWTDEEDRRRVTVDWTGPQCFQAAESFALKAYLRTLLQIPTGDKEADAEAQHSAEIIRASAEASRKKRETGEQHIAFDFGGGLENVPAASVPDRVCSRIAEIGDADEAQDWWDRHVDARRDFNKAEPRKGIDLKRKVEGLIDALRNPTEAAAE